MTTDNNEWLTSIQGKRVSLDMLQTVRSLLERYDNQSNKQLFETIGRILNDIGYPDDNTQTLTRYLYEHFLGLHIEPLDLSTENLVIQEFEAITRHDPSIFKKVPYIYTLQTISQKHDLNIKRTLEFPPEKRKYFDGLLKFYIDT